ncbi:MAG: hypothetical protein IJZ75_06515 [Clostridia bacterium]|nr:hypothetical protein [Clostridia bacterium]
MKKIIALILAITFIFTLCSCGKEKTSSDPDTSTPAQSQSATAPENYASVLLVTINPQFKLYLDKDGIVLALEAVNDDAKTFESEINFEDTKFDSVVENLITKANEKGFVKDNANVDFKVTEKKDEAVNVAFILNNVTATAKQTATKLEIKITVTTEDKTTAQETDDAESKPEESKPAESKPTEQTASHTHSFSAATCTEAKKCSCGATDGNALGHDYKDGKCSRCGAADPNAVSYTPIAKKGGTWSCQWFSGENAGSSTLVIYEDAPDGYMLYIGGYRLASPEEMNSEEAVVLNNGKTYIMGLGNGGEELDSVNESGNKITITLGDKKAEFQRTGENTMKLLSSTIVFIDICDIPAGTVFNYSTEE